MLAMIASESLECPQRRPRWFLPVAVRLSGFLITLSWSFADAVRPWVEQRQYGPFRYHADFYLGRHESIHKTRKSCCRSKCRKPLEWNQPKRSLSFISCRTNGISSGTCKSIFPASRFVARCIYGPRGWGWCSPYQSSEMETDLRHETTHAVLHSLLPMVPLWLDEGFAEYFEAKVTDKQLRHPYLQSIARSLKQGRNNNFGGIGIPERFFKNAQASLSGRLGLDTFFVAWSKPGSVCVAPISCRCQKPCSAGDFKCQPAPKIQRSRFGTIASPAEDPTRKSRQTR